MSIWLVWFKNNLTVVTTDGRDVGDLVQYVSELIIDGDDTIDELARDLAESVNNQQMIAAGIVPEGSIIFKNGNGTNNIEVPHMSYLIITLIHLILQQR